MRRVLILFCVMTAMVSLTLLAGLVWLVESTSGLQQLAQWAERVAAASNGQLKIEQVEGRLRDRLNIGHLRWHSEKLDVEIRRLHLEWSPQALSSRHLEVTRLDLGELRVNTPPSTHPEPMPADLQWPFGLTVRIGQWHVGQLQVDAHEVGWEIHGRYFSDARQHHVESLSLMSGDVALEGHGTLDELAPFSLSGAWQLRGQLEHRPVALMLETQGSLERIRVKAVAIQGVAGQAEAVITPWGSLPYENLHVQLDQIDPASWHRNAPKAQLSLTADVEPQVQGQGISGRFALRNHQPGPVDRQLLPVVALSGHVRWENESGEATFNELMAQVSGGGALSGKGLWRDRHLQLDLAAKQLDLEKMFSRLRPTRLTGGLSATLGSDNQAFRMTLRDERIQRVQLEAEARLQGAHLKIPHLKLIAQDAQLSAQGEMQLNAPRQFSVAGQVQHFDPSRFAKLPSARLNADWQATGRLVPHPQVEARFTILDSRIVQQALSGQGRLSLDWPRIPRVDVELKAGSNHVHVTGAHGQPGDRLTLNVEAPNLGELADLGLEGRLTGQGALSGDLDAPELSLKLTASQLGWRQHFRVDGMNVSLNAGMRPVAPLSLDLLITRLDLPEHPGLLQQFHLQGEGQLANHRLRAEADLEQAGSHHVMLALKGGWNETARAWRGQLAEAALKTEDRERNLHLVQPAPLGLSAQEWQMGPMILSSALLDGRVLLQGHADARQMQVEIKANGAKIGQVSGEWQAGMQGAWALDKTARWQGKIHTDIPDLGWLAGWMGDGWSSGGQLQGDVQVAGSPVHPVVSGHLQGSSLSLRLPGQGLSLARGVLDVDLRDNLLKIRRFEFESPLQPPPRALRLSSDENPDRWVAKVDKPGRLDIVGEMRLDQQADMSDAASVSNATNAWLDVHLDRVGAWQRSDQWILVSGRNRIGWKAGVLEVRGGLSVDAGYWQLARMGVPRLSEDVHVHRRVASSTDKPSTASLRPRLDLDVTADLGRHFLFEGAGLTSGLSGQIRLTAQGRDLPRASGSIQARNGRFEAYGQKLDIERGVLRFNGLLDNPGLDVRAVRTGLTVEPGVQIGGTAQKPVVKLISEPELPETEKLAWLVLGHGSEQMGVGDATLLLSAAGDLFGNDAGNVVGQLRKAFGIDEIGIRQGNLGDSGGRAPASRIAGGAVDTAANGNSQQIFSIGKRLSSNVLLSYEQAMGKAESLVKLTWSLSRQVSLIGRAGSDNAIDILYTMSFGKPAPIRKAGSMGNVNAGCSGGVDCAE